MARQEVSRTTHIEEGELRVTHENAILTNITPTVNILKELLVFIEHAQVFGKLQIFSYKNRILVCGRNMKNITFIS